MTIREMQDEILRLKKEKDMCILVHAYQSHDIWEIADYVGDSYGLSKEAAHRRYGVRIILIQYHAWPSSTAHRSGIHAQAWERM